jgi:8-oxo-dGTP diphosphatase
MVRVTVDVLIFTLRERALHVLLVKRGIPPFLGRWAIPGGFVHERESLDEAALRELCEETGVSQVYLEQLYAFGAPKRDPRGRVITVAYMALIASDRLYLRAGTDAAEARWWPVSAPPPLAFDHADILGFAIDRLRGKLAHSTLGFQLLAPRFTLAELQTMHEAVLGRRLDKRNFRRRILETKLVKPLRQHRSDAGGRPARLYRFDRAT